MRLGIKQVTAGLLALLALTACGKNENAPVATVGDRVITTEMYEHAYAKVDPKFLPKTTDMDGRKQFLNTMIDKELMALKADALGYDKDQYVVDGMKAFRKVGLQAGYTKYKVADRIKVTDKELRDYYAKYGLIYQIKQILVDTKEEADMVYDLLQQGNDFESVCRQYSKGPDAEQGGQQLSARFGTFPPAFQDELFSRKVGEITKPILSQYGYFVIKVVDQNQPQPPPFEQVKDDLAQLVRNQQQIKYSQEMAEDIRNRANFQFYEDNIKIAFDMLPPDRPLTNPPNRSQEVYPLLKVEPQDLEKPLVTYKDKSITIKDFSDLYDRASFFERPRREHRLGDIKKFLVDRVMNELVEEEMETSGIENDPQVAKLLQQKKEQLMVDKLYQDLIDKQTVVDDKDVQDYYEANKEQFRRPEERRFDAIVTGDRESAEQAREKLKAGDPFAVVRRQYSIEDLETQHANSDKFLQRGSQPEIDTYGFALERVGEISEPFESEKGWTVLKLVEKRPERILPLNEAENDIRCYLKTMANETRLKELLAKWREETPVKINEKNLEKATLEREQRRSVRFG